MKIKNTILVVILSTVGKFTFGTTTDGNSGLGMNYTCPENFTKDEITLGCYKIDGHTETLMHRLGTREYANCSAFFEPFKAFTLQFVNADETPAISVNLTSNGQSIQDSIHLQVSTDCENKELNSTYMCTTDLQISELPCYENLASLHNLTECQTNLQLRDLTAEITINQATKAKETLIIPFPPMATIPIDYISNSTTRTSSEGELETSLGKFNIIIPSKDYVPNLTLNPDGVKYTYENCTEFTSPCIRNANNEVVGVFSCPVVIWVSEKNVFQTNTSNNLTIFDATTGYGQLSVDLSPGRSVTFTGLKSPLFRECWSQSDANQLFIPKVIDTFDALDLVNPLLSEIGYRHLSHFQCNYFKNNYINGNTNKTWVKVSHFDTVTSSCRSTEGIILGFMDRLNDYDGFFSTCCNPTNGCEYTKKNEYQYVWTPKAAADVVYTRPSSRPNFYTWAKIPYRSLKSGLYGGESFKVFFYARTPRPFERLQFSAFTQLDIQETIIETNVWQTTKINSYSSNSVGLLERTKDDLTNYNQSWNFTNYYEELIAEFTFTTNTYFPQNTTIPPFIKITVISEQSNLFDISNPVTSQETEIFARSGIQLTEANIHVDEGCPDENGNAQPSKQTLTVFEKFRGYVCDGAATTTPDSQTVKSTTSTTEEPTSYAPTALAPSNNSTIVTSALSSSLAPTTPSTLAPTTTSTLAPTTTSTLAPTTTSTLAPTTTSTLGQSTSAASTTEEPTTLSQSTSAASTPPPPRTTTLSTTVLLVFDDLEIESTNLELLEKTIRESLSKNGNPEAETVEIIFKSGSIIAELRFKSSANANKAETLKHGITNDVKEDYANAVEPNNKDNASIIIISVSASLVGVLLLAALVIYYRKNKEKGYERLNGPSSLNLL